MRLPTTRQSCTRGRHRILLLGDPRFQAASYLLSSIAISRYSLHGLRSYQPLFHHDGLDPESFPGQFASFAEDVVTFLNCLNEFPEFTDEVVNTSMRAFEVDLKYRASCLQEYKEIGEHIDNITVNLLMFIEIGVPTIRFAQQHAAANLLNLSTVATFFSAVTATTLQFSYQLTDGVLENLLGLTWKQAMYRSPGHRVPRDLSHP
ncbi:uncharacterized protein EDB93DRAFT_892065 [Suillus bovinus]|uniref:uncharacterized protein n=1 Tax=Suillus bovinus TaxID=48563 RepID=UPI001B86C167|nr:uncharacterized protein EDB93DRAFT_892065 [Suillus bovinus]KAG2132922.1 hypothetical protein EDB93DRAFT_892065 [Suillus bovinus]